MRRLCLVFLPLVIIFFPQEFEFEEVDISEFGIVDPSGRPSFVDFNNDGHIDFWSNCVYINDGTGQFTRLETSEWGGGEIISWGDYNADGYPDALTCRTAWIDTTPRKDTVWILLYENSGPPDFAMVDVSAEVGLGFPILDRDLNDPAWLDYDSDGLLDFFYSSYEFVPLNSEDDYPYWSGHEDYLFHNTGTVFEDVSDAAGIRAGGTDTLCARGVSVADYDNDGDADIFVSVYRLQPNILWRNDGGFYTNVAEEAGVIGIFAQDYYGHNIGAAWGDYNNDGYLDLFTPITHHAGYPGDYTSHLWSSSGPPGWEFTDNFAASGMNNSEIGSAPVWVDYDNDGDLDLYWLNLYGTPGKQGWLYRNEGDNLFTDVTYQPCGIKTWGNKSYVLWIDINEDGKMDVYAPYSNTAGSYKIFFINTAERGHWLELDLEGRNTSNRSGIGTRVWAYAGDLLVLRENFPSNGNGYGNMYIPRQHLGLGDYSVVDSLLIRWPSGRTDKIRNLNADRIIGMVEGPPSAPTDLGYAHLGGDQYRFGWVAPPERDVAGYRLWQRYISADPWVILADEIPAGSASYTVMLEPPVGEVSITAFDYCEEDNESPHSAIAVGIDQDAPDQIATLDVGCLLPIIPCRFNLSESARIELTIYDRSGRRIRTLASGYFASGIHELRWAGTDDAGIRVASGIYFVILETGQLKITRKTILR